MSPVTPVRIIAELGMTHNGDLRLAKRLIDAAASCGADAVKFQLHIAEAEMLPHAPPPPYFRDEPRWDYFRRTAFTPAQWAEVKRHAERRGTAFLCSAFSIEAVERLERLGVETHKIPSGEVTNVPLLERVARSRKPVLLSSGMSSWEELDHAVAVFRRSGSALTVLQCTSAYPCPDEDVGLDLIPQMRARYGVPVGFSDHTLANYASFAAVTLGATVLERHVTISRSMYGSDAKHSLEPAEFTDLVRGVRSIERMMRHPGNKKDHRRFATMKRIFEKSLVAACDVAKGERLTAAMIAARKPGTGVSARRFHEAVGSRARRSLRAGALIRPADLAWRRVCDGSRA